MIDHPGCAKGAEWDQLFKHGKPAFLKWKALTKSAHEAEYILATYKICAELKNMLADWILFLQASKIVAIIFEQATKMFEQVTKVF